ncbi:MAG: heavy-metal-associated domain-containing protein [Actinomycetota bacterium]|nr:heavy-metal-associated domain-containing protein [Actinomycetota bacterium]
MAKTEIKIGGMSCQHCVMAVKKALAGVDGIQNAQVEIGKAVVEYDEAKVKPEAVENAIAKAGYKVLKD